MNIKVGLPGTDVKDEELEQIRLLEAEEAISADVEGKIKVFHGKVKAGINFLDTFLEDLPNFRKRIIQDLRSPKNEFLLTMQRLSGELSNGVQTVNEVINEIMKLFQISKRVIQLIDHVESKQSSRVPSLNIKGRKITKKAQDLEESEKRQIRTKSNSLRIVVSALLVSNRSVGIAVYRLTFVATNYYQAQRRIGYNTDSSHSFASRRIIQIETNMREAKSHLSSAEDNLETAQIAITRFKDYLRTPKKESKQALEYERLIGRLNKILGAK